MTENQVEDPHAEPLRQALRSLRADTPANELARASILASVKDNSALFEIALEETAYPQAELDLHLTGEEEEAMHSTRADWFGRFVARLSSAVNEVTKSMAKKRRLTPGLRLVATPTGSVRVLLRAPLPKQTQESIPDVDDTTAESRALRLITGLLVMAGDQRPPSGSSPLTATVQGLSGAARARVRSVARSVIETSWEVEGTLSQRGKPLERVQFTARSAQLLFDELDREVQEQTSDTRQGRIDGQRHSLSTMWFIPDGQVRAIEVAVTDVDLLDKVTRLSAIPDLRVECRFAVFVSTPAGASEEGQRSYELVSIEELPTPQTLPANSH